MNANPEVDLGKEHASEDGINWGTAIAMGFFTWAPLPLLFFFTWKAFFVAMFPGGGFPGASASDELSPSAHPSWIQDAEVVEYFLTWCATLALEGGPIFLVATHRIHHQYSDEHGGPNPPMAHPLPSHGGMRIAVFVRVLVMMRCVAPRKSVRLRAREWRTR